MTTYNPAEVERLIAEAREDDARMTRAPWRRSAKSYLQGAIVIEVDGRERQVASADGSPGAADDIDDDPEGRRQRNSAAIARTRNNLRAMADQLEAARAKIRRLEQRDAFAERADEHKSRVIADLSAEIEKLTAPLAIDDLFAGRFGVFIASRDPDSWQARGPQRQLVAEAERDRDAANGAQQLVADLARLRSELDTARAQADRIPDLQADVGYEIERSTAALLQLDVARTRIAELEGAVERMAPVVAAVEAWRDDPAKGFGSRSELALNEAIAKVRP